MATPIPPNRAELSAYWLAAAASGTLRGAERAVGRGLVTDSRLVAGGEVFLALSGESFDGHAFVDEALRRGAAVIVAERGRVAPRGEAALVEVDDTLVALGAIGAAHLRGWRRSGGRGIVAVTGSAGKTTTKELTARLLASVDATWSTPGNLNNRVGMPMVALAADASQRFLVLEMGMSVPGEIDALARIARPDVAIITNVDMAHAEGVGGTRADVAREKGALYAALDARATAVVNADDPAASAQLARTEAHRAVFFGRSERADYRLVDRTPLGEGGARVRIERPTGALELVLPVASEVVAIDLLAALAAAECLAGECFDVAAIEGAVAKLDRHGRGRATPLADGTLLLDDSYNANPASVRAALAHLAEIAGERRTVAVLGEMRELGARSAEEHAAVGALAAELGIDLLVGCGPLVDHALAEARRAGVKTVASRDASEAAARCLELIQGGDVVLVKGSRSVRTELVIEALIAQRGSASPEHP